MWQYKCVDCGSTNTLTHRLTSYRDTETILSWTWSKLAMMLQTDRRYISATWSLSPTFSYWPKTRHNALVWTLGHMMHYSIAKLKGCRPIELFIHTHIHVYIHTNIHTCTHTYIHIHTYTHACMHACIHTYTHTHTIIHTYIHEYVYIIHMYIHTYIHTHTHTHIYT